MRKSDLINHLAETLPKITIENGYKTDLGRDCLYGLTELGWNGRYSLQWIDLREEDAGTGKKSVSIQISAVGYCDQRDALAESLDLELDINGALNSVSCLSGGKVTLEKNVETRDHSAVEALFTIVYMVIS